MSILIYRVEEISHFMLPYMSCIVKVIARRALVAASFPTHVKKPQCKASDDRSRNLIRLERHEEQIQLKQESLHQSLKCLNYSCHPTSQPSS